MAPLPRLFFETNLVDKIRRFYGTERDGKKLLFQVEGDCQAKVLGKNACPAGS